jgi:hypothetical protein
MSIADYRIVQKPFSLDNNEKLRPDQPVNITGWRNLQGLENGRYLRRPMTEEDYNLITAFMDQENEATAPKRGRPPKIGGEN